MEDKEKEGGACVVRPAGRRKCVEVEECELRKQSKADGKVIRASLLPLQPFHMSRSVLRCSVLDVAHGFRSQSRHPGRSEVKWLKQGEVGQVGGRAGAVSVARASAFLPSLRSALCPLSVSLAARQGPAEHAPKDTRARALAARAAKIDKITALPTPGRLRLRSSSTKQQQASRSDEAITSLPSYRPANQGSIRQSSSSSSTLSRRIPVPPPI